MLPLYCKHCQLRTISLTILGNYKDSFDIATKTPNRSMDFVPNKINLVFTFCYSSQFLLAYTLWCQEYSKIGLLSIFGSKSGQKYWRLDWFMCKIELSIIHFNPKQMGGGQNMFHRNQKNCHPTKTATLSKFSWSFERRVKKILKMKYGKMLYVL